MNFRFIIVSLILLTKQVRFETVNLNFQSDCSEQKGFDNEKDKFSDSSRKPNGNCAI